ncbi:MAG: hypothetical protein TRG1_1620 [Flavobacteriaceae bacterium FS1-H7996/R]|nr:MAG: hypothetical protein TRG1_1620 [Flavobacteriaceae bacterium FS1-H7996/R]
MSGSICWLNVAVIIVFITTSVSLSSGLVEMTIGETVAPVLNVQTYSSCRALPLRSFTEVFILPVYVVLISRGAAGVKVAVNPLYVTVPVIAAPDSIIKDASVIVVGFISTLKVTVITWESGTLVASFSGLVAITRGHIPMVSIKSSFSQAAKRTSIINVKIDNGLNVFIY